MAAEILAQCAGRARFRDESALETVFEVIDLAAEGRQIRTTEHDDPAGTRPRRDTRQRIAGGRLDCRAAFVAMHDREGHAEPRAERVEGLLAPHGTVGDIAEGTLEPPEQMADDVPRLTGDPAVGVIHPDQLGDDLRG